MATQMIKLFTEFPCAGTNDANFGLEIQAELSKVSYGLIVNHIEFRRRCMNQGFDNLLELLKMHYDALQVVRDAASPEPAKEGCENPSV